jgi:hypothetical protein
MNIEEYSYLWSDPEGEWALEKLQSKDSYMIITSDGAEILCIEDDDIYEAVIQRMLHEGVQVFEGPVYPEGLIPWAPTEEELVIMRRLFKDVFAMAHYYKHKRKSTDHNAEEDEPK